MNLRSLLFVPGDRPERMEKALGLGADALILDLEDSVALATKMSARRVIASFLGATHRTVKLFVRINPLDGALVEDDLAAIVPAEPDAIVLPKAEGAESIRAEIQQQVDDEWAQLQARCAAADRRVEED